MAVGYDDPGFTQLDAGFQQKLRSFIEASGGRVWLVSGYRSVERQQQLWEEALRKYGDPEIADDWVARPGASDHNHGVAGDLGFKDDAAREWAHAHAAEFGLHFPMSWEPWHIEPSDHQPKAEAMTNPPGAIGTAGASSGGDPRQPLRSIGAQVTNLGVLLKTATEGIGPDTGAQPVTVAASASPPAGQGTQVSGQGIQAVVQAAKAAGFTGEALVTAVAVAMAESGGVPQKSKFEGEESYGMWQVHIPSHPEYTPDQMMDPTQNAQAAFKISGGGQNWKPWSVYKSGAYQQYLDDARAAVGMA
jgi:hypothetical protein